MPTISATARVGSTMIKEAFKDEKDLQHPDLGDSKTIVVGPGLTRYSWCVPLVKRSRKTGSLRKASARWTKEVKLE